MCDDVITFPVPEGKLAFLVEAYARIIDLPDPSNQAIAGNNNVENWAGVELIGDSGLILDKLIIGGNSLSSVGTLADSFVSDNAWGGGLGNPNFAVKGAVASQEFIIKNVIDRANDVFAIMSGYVIDN